METDDKKIILERAQLVALAFGAVSGSYIFIENALYDFFLKYSFVQSILWGVKFVGLILLLSYFMKKLQKLRPKFTAKELHLFGRWVAFYSAMITAACAYICFRYAFPEVTASAIDAAYAQLGNTLDDASRTALQMLEGNMPIYALVGNFIWCFLYGTILSRLLASSIAGPRNPMNEDDDDE